MAFAHDGAAKWPTLRVTIVITVVQKIAIAVAEMDLDQAVVDLDRGGFGDAVDIGRYAASVLFSGMTVIIVTDIQEHASVLADIPDPAIPPILITACQKSAGKSNQDGSG
jgi:hypothetical protein